jgi:hypothetical protein
MKSVRKRLTYANVMSSIAVFLVVAGGSAFAANQLGKNTVGSKQLKKNAVTAAKIKNGSVVAAKLGAGAVSGAQLGTGAVTESKLAAGAVSGAKIADGAVGGSKLADGAVTGSKLAAGAVGTANIGPGAVTGAQINSATVPFSQVVARVRGAGAYNLQTAAMNPVGGYTQAAGEDDVFIGAVEVTFASTCTQPRSAVAYLIADPANPGTLTASEIAGYGVAEDKGTGTVTKTMNFAPLTGGSGMARFGTGSATPHNFYLYPAGGTCTAGSGITGTVGVDVIGTK